jgi:peroxiredoxin
VTNLAVSRPRHTARWVAAAVAVALVVVAIVAATRPSEQASQIETPLVGHSAPTFSATSFSGAPVSLGADSGDVVIVNFFASWCPPCAAEEPNLVRFAFEQQQQGSSVKLISVDIDDNAAAGARFAKQWGATWPVVPDHAGSIAYDFGVGSPPVTFLIGRSGIVLEQWVGPMSYDQLNAMVSMARTG